MKKKRKKIFRKEAVFVLIVFLAITSFLFIQKRGEIYKVDSQKKTYLKGDVPTSNEVFATLSKDTLVLVDSADPSSLEAKEQFEQILKDMRMGYQTVDVAAETIPEFSAYQKVVILLSALDLMQERTPDLMAWVADGGNVLFGMTLFQEEILKGIDQDLGVLDSNPNNAVVSSIFIDDTFMIGGGKAYKIDEPFDAARTVSLSDDSKVYAWIDDNSKNPLVWEKDYGSGHFVIDNLGFYDRSVRGIHAASYSLLTDTAVYPVIDGATYYLDDFPAPVPAGNASFIKRDYNMSVSDFYTNVWWPDLLKLHDKYGIKYTGLVIENYEDDTSGKIKRQEDTERFNYFGSSILANDGEIGYHGYNHQPFSLDNVDYGDVYPNYKTWASTEAMAASMTELDRFIKDLFPDIETSVYVPPSNVLSAEGRQMLVSQFPQVKSIASNYFSEDFAYSQEFEIADDGMIEQPRTVSGTIWDDYAKLTAFSELNMHFVNNHFMHPDDALDEDRGAANGWAKMFESFEKDIVWIEESAPDLRKLTGSELAGAVQRYAILTVQQSQNENGLNINLGNFHDEAYLMVRLNNEAKPGNVSGGSLTHLTGNLYLLQAKEAQVTIEMK
ncbi:DUF2194 domain-containing protein [Streptococcus chenjunshii]|uniref:DUF2194 domain-containing protein n=1 Tax=Streptococcus chenjunshii TaxID=2173853 RepID=A0A372KMX7_9STRE|nr:DUF2194 domain-containing protein [Streptococcus chenjunshii]AXQ79015.1 DUF2194 domain-containing protein [Streptococcus chenjunshii]RFU51442.1 DUF2194 domain-containing protein [Streptococcus chenjunshii]RFU53642.1 DUF2194 domain-containing protein [Streptococcus chenjunshii]